MEYGTIKIPEPAYEYHNERRQELGLTWEKYINGEEPAGGVDETELAAAIVDDLRADHPDDGDSPVTLDAGEYAKIADEVEGRMR